MAKCEDYSNFAGASSDKVRVICCEPCLNGDKQLKAEGFCVDCREYLCRQCYNTHKRSKAFKHHLLQDMDKMSQYSQQPSFGSEKICKNHSSKIIEYFCRSCDMLGCHVCITLNHRLCENVDHIPEVSKDLNKSEEFKTFLNELESRLKEIEKCKKVIRLNTNTSDYIKEQGKTELKRQRYEINKYFDLLESDMDKRIEEIHESNKKVLQSARYTANSILGVLTEIESNVKSNQNENQSCDLFITMKQSQVSFEKLDTLFEKLKQESKIQRYSLTSSNQIQNIKHSISEICKLRSAKFVSTIKFNNRYDDMCITGLAIVQEHFLAIVDDENKSVKVIDTNSNHVVSKMALQCENARNITAVKPFQLAVLMTSDGKSKIQLLSLDFSGNISEYSHVKLQEENMISGAFLVEGGKFLMIGYQNVLIFDAKGSHLDSLPTSYATGIACSSDGTAIYLSDPVENTVTSLTLDGEVKAVYKDSNMKGPDKMTVDDEGNIYVCCQDTVYQLSGDLSFGHLLIDDWSRTITFCLDNKRLYLGQDNVIKEYEIGK